MGQATDPPNILINGKTHRVTLLSGHALLPDTRKPYIIAEATYNNSQITAYFKKWMLGAISHGFDRFAYDFNLLFNLLVQNFKVPQWENDLADKLKNKDFYDDVISFDWMHTCAAVDPTAVGTAGDKLADQIARWISKNTSHEGDVVDVHLIGHSRGAVVVTLALEKLKSTLNDNSKNPLLGSYVELTLLDPHPASNEWEKSWSDSSFFKIKEQSVDCYMNPIPNEFEYTEKYGRQTSKIKISNVRPFDYTYWTVVRSLIKGNPIPDLIHMGNLTGDDSHGKYHNWNWFSHESRYMRDYFHDSTQSFQTSVHDPKVIISDIVKSIDVWYQHTKAYNLYYQDYQEFIQNLWGVVSLNALVNKSSAVIDFHSLTDLNDPLVGYVGHNEVPLIYLNRIALSYLNRTDN